MTVYICLLCGEDFQIEYGDIYTPIKHPERPNEHTAICDDCADKIISQRLAALGMTAIIERRN